jgi:hypothetical protein
MARDSLFGERIVWQGRCQNASLPFASMAMAFVASVISIVTLAYAVVIVKALAVPVDGMVVFSAWCATLALAAWRVPIWWRSRLEYLVTEKHVIWRRGPIRRTIAIGQISYARICWSSGDHKVGDLVLVRAVPTGALRRTLSLTLSEVPAPDRLWAMIRGVEPSPTLGSGDRPLAQRLDPGERVLWSGAPLAAAWTTRRALTAFVAGVLTAVFVQSLFRSVPTFARLLRLHALPPSLAAVLITGAALGMLLLLAIAAGVAYVSIVRPQRLARATRYFVTDARVLIRRGDEELSLDRSRIAYVIDAPWRNLHDVFLVIDGPQARALAPSGAFGGIDRDDALRPVFAAIADAEGVGAILRDHDKRAA